MLFGPLLLGLLLASSSAGEDKNRIRQAGLGASVFPEAFAIQDAKDAPQKKPNIEKQPRCETVEKDGFVESVAIDPVGSWLITGSSDGAVRLWDIRAEQPFRKSSFILRGHDQPVRQLAITPSGRWLATYSHDGKLRLWDLSAKNPAAMSQLLIGVSVKQTRKEDAGWVLEISGNSRWLVARSSSQPEWTKIWDLQAEDPKANSVLLEMSATLELCANRRWLVSGGPKADKIDAWDLNTENPWAKPITFSKPRRTTADALSPDGRRLFARRFPGADPAKDDYLFWDLKETNPSAKVLISHSWPTPPRSSEISSDGKWLAVAFDPDPNPGAIDLWDLRNNDPTKHHLVLRGHENTVRTLLFSPNCRWLVSGADDITARIWDLQAKNPGAAPKVISVNVEIASISSNSHWLATSDRHTVKLWNLEDPDRSVTTMLMPERFEKDLEKLLFTPDSRWLVAHGAGKTVRCWDIASICSP
jgi:WD40 repeat protein